MKISVIKSSGAFYPIGDESTELMKSLENKEYVISLTTHRNNKFHRLAFSLLNMIFDNQDGFTNFDIFREWITMKAGYVITGVAPNGTTVFMAESLSFESMPQEKFERWYSSVIDVAIKQYGMDEEMLNRILSFV